MALYRNTHTTLLLQIMSTPPTSDDQRMENLNELQSGVAEVAAILFQEDDVQTDASREITLVSEVGEQDVSPTSPDIHDDDDNDDSVSDWGVKKNSFWVKKYSAPRDTLPETTKRPERYDGEPRPKKQRCSCNVMDMETSWNMEVPTSFHSQLKQMNYEKTRTTLTPDNFYMHSEFQVGIHMRVIVAILSDESLEASDRVILLIQQGVNQIKAPAVRFLSESIPMLKRGLSLHPYDMDVSMELPLHNCYAEFFRDETTQWFILRQYSEPQCLYIRDRMYISYETWTEIKQHLPLLKGIAEKYTELVNLGKAFECPLRPSTPPPIDVSSPTSRLSLQASTPKPIVTIVIEN